MPILDETTREAPRKPKPDVELLAAEVELIRKKIEDLGKQIKSIRQDLFAASMNAALSR